MNVCFELRIVNIPKFIMIELIGNMKIHEVINDCQIVEALTTTSLFSFKLE